MYGITLPDVYCARPAHALSPEPEGFAAYTRLHTLAPRGGSDEWMSVIDVLQFDWAGVVVPGACIGDAHITLTLLKALVPLGGMFILLIGGWLYDLAMLKWRREPVIKPFRGLLKTLPLVLFVSFSLCPTVSTSIFQAWSCDTFVEHSREGTSRQYLRNDLSVRCSDAFYTDETHSTFTSAATFLVFLWPVALPLIYIKLLLTCHKDILTNRTTGLVSATAFLHREYSTGYFWWMSAA